MFAPWILLALSSIVFVFGSNDQNEYILSGEKSPFFYLLQKNSNEPEGPQYETDYEETIPVVNNIANSADGKSNKCNEMNPLLEYFYNKDNKRSHHNHHHLQYRNCHMCRSNYSRIDFGYGVFPRYVVTAVCGYPCKEIPYKIHQLSQTSDKDSDDSNLEDLPDWLSGFKFVHKTVTIASACHCAPT